MILGTAGHIDHGKTTLVRALTGVDTDRLPEEKRRGITIELGFAPLELPGAGRLGVVDVPGHEAFVRTMLAGATGVDLALLVIAADEGMMPQTHEHLAILSLLGVRGGVVALTKRDLVDEEWLALVEDDVRGALAGTGLADAAIVPTAAASGAGLDELRAALRTAALAVPARDAADLFRMPIDRAFTVRGTGTVVTGTVWSGALRRDAAVRILPRDRTARVRGVQSHGAQVDVALPGHRAAIALAGVEVDEVGRGAMLVEDASWRATRILRADVALLESAPIELRPRAWVRFHLGTSEVGARVVAPGGALGPGERGAARLMLDAPVVARAGDRFVLRSASPVVTIGGGIVTDPLPAVRRPRPWGGDLGPADRLRLMLAEGGGQGLEYASLPVRLGMPPSALEPFIASLDGAAVVLGDRLFDTAEIVEVAGRVQRLVAAHHQAHPLEPGASLQSVRAAVAAAPAAIDRAVRDLTAGGALEIAGAIVRERGWVPHLSPAQGAVRDSLLRALSVAGREPPSVGELSATHGPDVAPLLRLLEREGVAVQVEPDRYYEASAADDLVATLRGAMRPGEEYGPGELREILGLSRKYLIPFLEYCDRSGVTERMVRGRVLRGT